MVNGNIKTFIMVLLGGLILSFTLYFSMNSMMSRDYSSLVERATEVALHESFDYSSRVDEGLLIVDRNSFERKVKDSLNSDFPDGLSLSYEFDYLEDGSTRNTHGVRVKVTVQGEDFNDGEASSYFATYVLDFNGGN